LLNGGDKKSQKGDVEQAKNILKELQKELL